MQAALQFLEHCLQFTHFEVSITGLNHEKRAMKPSTVPTGQIVLQYVRPFFQANIPIIIRVAAARRNAGRLRSQTSVS